LIGILYAVSGEHFLPWMRYRAMPEWSPEERHYQLRVIHALDTTYRVDVFAPRSSRRTWITWLGDSVRTIRYNDGFYRLGTAAGDLVALDTSIISVSGNRLIPHHVGVCRMLATLPTGTNRFTVRVVSEDDGLAVYQDETSAK
jgi:hypothetical protein